MFLLPCGDTVAHSEHEHVKHWIKAQLGPYLQNASSYPDSWDVTYRCPGIEGIVNPNPVKGTQWFAYWEGVHDSVQHWANGTPMRCPYDAPEEAKSLPC